MATTVTTDPTINAQSRVPTIIALSVVFALLSFTVVVLRLYTRLRILRNSGLDDLTIVVAEVLAIGAAIATVFQAEYGLGRHAWTVEESETFKQLKALYAVTIIYNLSQTTVKISFLLQYRRIFTGPTMQKACLWFMIFIIIWGILQEFLVAFACVPVSIFEPRFAGKCIKSLVIWYLTSVMNIVTDFGIFILPMPAIRALQLRKRPKAILFSIFCLGFFACIISIVRIFSLKIAADSTDPSWDNVDAASWTMVELNVGIVCACLPTLRPLLTKLVPDQSTKASGNEFSLYASARSDGTKARGLYNHQSFNKPPPSGSTEILRENSNDIELGEALDKSPPTM